MEPAQVVDWLALTGDPSDNIPGARPLPGREPKLAEGEKKRSYIGPKGATELIQQFGTLEKALENYEQVKKQSYRDALRDFRKEALLSRELATIRTDVPLEASIEELRCGAPGHCGTYGALSGVGLHLPPARVSARSSRAGRGCDRIGGINHSCSRRTVAGRSWPAGAMLALSQRRWRATKVLRAVLPGLALRMGRGWPRSAVGASWDLLQPLAAMLGDANRPKAVHNSKLLQLLLAKQGIALAGVADDTMLYSYLLEPLASSHALADAVLRRQGRKISASLAEAAHRTHQLSELLRPEIVREDLQNLYSEIELPLASVLAEVEAAGVRIDAEILARMSGEFDKELTTLTHEIYDLAGGAFDIDSPKQLGEILFERLKLPGGKRLKKSGQYSTDASVLEALAEKHDLPRKIIDYRTRAKLKSTYIDALPKFIQPGTGRLHTTFQPNRGAHRAGSPLPIPTFKTFLLAMNSECAFARRLWPIPAAG